MEQRERHSSSITHEYFPANRKTKTKAKKILKTVQKCHICIHLACFYCEDVPWGRWMLVLGEALTSMARSISSCVLHYPFMAQNITQGQVSYNSYRTYILTHSVRSFRLEAWHIIICRRSSYRELWNYDSENKYERRSRKRPLKRTMKTTKNNGTNHYLL